MTTYRIKNKNIPRIAFNGTQKQYEWIKKQAKKHETSLTEIIRALIDCAMEQEKEV